MSEATESVETAEQPTATRVAEVEIDSASGGTTDRDDDTPGAGEPTSQARSGNGADPAAAEVGDGAPSSADHGSGDARRDAATTMPAGTAAPHSASDEPGDRRKDAAETPPAAPAKKPRPRLRDPALARAFRARRPVAGRVVAVIKGGYEVRVGRSRAFCPHSQIDLHRVEDPETRIGKSYTFRVSQFRRGGEDIVLSRRALLEEEQADEAKAVRAALVEGSRVRGKVVGTADFGAFVDLGAGVMGLVHISELSHSRVTRVRDVVKIGDPITVKILKLDENVNRISLSVRHAQDDPWEGAAEAFPAGRHVRGKVLRLADFGAFVELRPGVEALAPAREFPPRAEGWSQGLEPGSEMEWLVLSIDPARRRISVVPAPEDPEAATELKIEPGATLAGKVQKVERYGVFVWLGPGRVGLVPGMWTGAPRDQMSRRFPVGRDVEVEVVEVGADPRRIRLAVKGHGPSKTRPDLPAPRAPRQARAKKPPVAATSRPTPPEVPESFGTNLGDALRAALHRRDA